MERSEGWNVHFFQPVAAAGPARCSATPRHDYRDPQRGRNLGSGRTSPHHRQRGIEARHTRARSWLSHRGHRREALRRSRLPAGLPGLSLGPPPDGDGAVAERACDEVRRREARLCRLPHVPGQARPPHRQRHYPLHHGLPESEGIGAARPRDPGRADGRGLHRLLATADHRFRADRPRQGSWGEVSDPRPRRRRDEARRLLRVPLANRECLFGPPCPRPRSGQGQSAHRRAADVSLCTTRHRWCHAPCFPRRESMERRAAPRACLLGGTGEGHQ